MELTIYERVKKIMEYKKVSANALSKLLGMPQTTVNNYIKGSRGISFELIEGLAKLYPDISYEWLLTGEGQMLTTANAQGSAPVPSNAILSEDVTEMEYAGENSNYGLFFRSKATGQLHLSVPHVPFAARGEFPNLADSLEPLSAWGREDYEVDFKVGGRYLSFDIRGDSMDNGIHDKCLQDGDKVLVRELEHEHWRTLKVGDHRFWVLVFGSSVLIKEISRFDPSTGTVTCHSLNPSPEYHDFSLQLDEVRHLYYVIKKKPREIAFI